MADDDRPIIIKKVYKKSGDGHHGGAWKVAYADFVTAMMAFFLLMWLLNVATEEQLAGLANYFSPISASESRSGSGGVLGGLSLSEEGALVSQSSPVGANTQTADGDVEVVDNNEDLSDAELLENGAITESQFERMKAQEEEEMFAAAKEELQQAIEGIPELAELANNLIVDQTPEGLRIQIVDQAGNSMFPLGSTKMYDKTYNLLAKVSEVIEKLPNQISIRGHTDSVKYSPNALYNNWDLSADRANASRLALVRAGLSPSRIYNIVGKADKEHLFPDDPMSPQNRRISIVLLRDEVVKSGMEATGKAGTAQGVEKERPDWEVDPMTRKWNKPFLRNR